MPNSKISYMSTSEGDSLKFNYRLENGIVNVDHYGLKVAEKLGLPQELVNISNEFCQQVLGIVVVFD